MISGLFRRSGVPAPARQAGGIPGSLRAPAPMMNYGSLRLLGRRDPARGQAVNDFLNSCSAILCATGSARAEQVPNAQRFSDGLRPGFRIFGRGDRHSCLSVEKAAQVKGQTGMSVPRSCMLHGATCHPAHPARSSAARPPQARSPAVAPGTRCATGRPCGRIAKGTQPAARAILHGATCHPAHPAHSSAARLPQARSLEDAPGARCAIGRPRGRIAKGTQPAARAILHGATCHPAHPAHSSAARLPQARSLEDAPGARCAIGRPRGRIAKGTQPAARAILHGATSSSPHRSLERYSNGSITHRVAGGRMPRSSWPSSPGRRRLRPSHPAVPCCAAQHRVPRTDLQPVRVCARFAGRPPVEIGKKCRIVPAG